MFHVTPITHRKDAVYPATIVGIPPMEDFYMGGASAQLFLPVFKMNFPENVDLALVWISRKFAVPFLELGDLLISITPPGLLFGRVANFVNGELWGKVSTVPWAVIFLKSVPPGTPMNLISPRHPSQIYEALLEGTALLVYTQWRLWHAPALNVPDQLSGEFLIGYAVARIICEQFRQPDASLILGMSRGIFYSIFLLVTGVLLVLFVDRQSTRSDPAPASRDAGT